MTRPNAPPGHAWVLCDNGSMVPILAFPTRRAAGRWSTNHYIYKYVLAPRPSRGKGKKRGKGK